MISDDRQMTANRKKLKALYSKEGIIPSKRRSFSCSDLQSCRSAAPGKLITGTWAYIGTSYGRALVNGRRTRILFVAMDRGGHEGDPLDLASTQSDFRNGAEKPGNAHMGGVHLLLRELVDDKDSETFARQFALTNAVKCRRASGTMRATCHEVMVANCSAHLREEIGALQPMVIITQGGHPGSTVKQFEDFAGQEAIATFTHNDKNLSEAKIFHSKRNGFILLTTPHPTRLKGLKWAHNPRKLPQFLIDAVRRVRRELGKE